MICVVNFEQTVASADHAAAKEEAKDASATAAEDDSDAAPTLSIADDAPTPDLAEAEIVLWPSMLVSVTHPVVNDPDRASCVRVRDVEIVAEEDRFQAVVRPTEHPRLTAACVARSGVSQEQADGAQSIDVVLAQWCNWLQPHLAAGTPMVFASWGREALSVHLPQELKRKGIPLPRFLAMKPFNPTLNVQVLMARTLGSTRVAHASELQELLAALHVDHRLEPDAHPVTSWTARLLCVISSLFPSVLHRACIAPGLPIVWDGKNQQFHSLASPMSKRGRGGKQPSST